MKSICFCPKSVSCFGLLTTAKGAAPLHMVQYAAVLSLFKPTNILNSGILTLLHDTIFFKVYCSHKFTEQLFLAWHNIQKNSLRIKFHKNNLSFVGAGCAISFMASRGGFRFAVGLIASWPNFHPRGWRDFFFFFFRCCRFQYCSCCAMKLFSIVEDYLIVQAPTISFSRHPHFAVPATDNLHAFCFLRFQSNQ